MEIREISVNDIDDFISLSGQLGYEAEKRYIEECLSSKNKNEIVFVAEKSKRIIGWIDCKINQSFLSEPYGEIVGFIVDEHERSKGVGKSLLKRAELWMIGKNVGRILVHSNIKRERAHKFYQINGYDLIKKSMLFKKEI